MTYINNYRQTRDLADRLLVQARDASSTSVGGLGSRKGGDLKSVEATFSDIDNAAYNATNYLAQVREVFGGDKIQEIIDEQNQPLLEEFANDEVLEVPGSRRPIARADSPLSPDTPERDILAKTIEAEAGNQDFSGKLAVASVIANRVGDGRWGESLMDVILAPGQFSAWNSVTGYAGGEQGQNMYALEPSEDSYAIADMILSGDYESPVGTATHYYNPSISTPDWGQSAGGEWQRLGAHLFGYAD